MLQQKFPDKKCLQLGEKGKNGKYKKYMVEELIENLKYIINFLNGNSSNEYAKLVVGGVRGNGERKRLLHEAKNDLLSHKERLKERIESGESKKKKWEGVGGKVQIF